MGLVLIHFALKIFLSEIRSVRNLREGLKLIEKSMATFLKKMEQNKVESLLKPKGYLSDQKFSTILTFSVSLSGPIFSNFQLCCGR